MDKIFLALAVIALAALAFLYLAFFGIQAVGTDKDSYLAGEQVAVSWSDFRFYSCTCPSLDLQMFRETSLGWERIIRYDPAYLRFSGFACVDGELSMMPFPCDVVACNFFQQPATEGEFAWNQTIIEEKGTTETCEKNTPIGVEGPFVAYETKSASAGRYKFKFGSAEKVFEIK
ncbi:MAG: hypothetical protein V1493_06345 [Candidatus Diapherotrites archaeon]